MDFVSVIYLRLHTCNLKRRQCWNATQMFTSPPRAPGESVSFRLGSDPVTGYRRSLSCTLTRFSALHGRVKTSPICPEHPRLYLYHYHPVCTVSALLPLLPISCPYNFIFQCSISYMPIFSVTHSSYSHPIFISSFFSRISLSFYLVLSLLQPFPDTITQTSVYYFLPCSILQVPSMY